MSQILKHKYLKISSYMPSVSFLCPFTEEDRGLSVTLNQVLAEEKQRTFGLDTLELPSKSSRALD